MSIDQTAMMLCGWEVKANMNLTSLVDKTRGWQANYCDLSLTRSIPERPREKYTKSSAVAKLGDPLATIDMGRKVG